MYTSKYGEGNRKKDTHYDFFRILSLLTKHGMANRVRLGSMRQVIIFVLALLFTVFMGIGHVVRAHADPLPAEYEYGTISSDTEWTSGYVYVIESQVVIPSGITLTIDPGAIVKYETGFGYNNIEVDSGGTLDATGTSENPIIFTSYKDDSVGGDTNGDGTSSGSPGDYGEAIDNENGTVDLSYATIEYAGGDSQYGLYQHCMYGDPAALSLTDDTFDSNVDIDNCTGGPATLQNNLFDVSTGPAIYAVFSDPSGISLSGATENTFTGTGQSLEVELEDDTIESGSTWSADGTSGAIIVPYSYGADAAPLVVDGTFDMGAGTIVKGDATYGNIEVDSGGTLDATGTSENPIIFTSYKDDSVGGDTNGDGTSSGSPGDYGEAIDNENGTVDLSYATIEYAGGDSQYGLYQHCMYGDPAALSLTDDTFDSNVDIDNCTGGPATLQNNLFDVSTGPAIYAVFSDPSGISLSGATENTFTGTGQSLEVELEDDTIESGSTWSADGTSGAIIVPYSYGADAAPLVVDGTFDMGAGTIVKGDATYGNIEVDSGGTLDATGTSENPIIFTSYKDDSVGGDTNGDGTSSGSPGDYGEAIDNENGTVDLSYATIEYAGGDSQYGLYISSGRANFEDTNLTNDESGLEVSGNATVTFRGSFSSITVGRAIEACDWSTDGTCSVDAGYTNWGSVNGPFAEDSDDNMACGAVTASIWTYGGSNYTNTNLYQIKNCDDSDTPDTILSSSISAFQGGVSYEEGLCDGGLFEDACDAADSAYACLSSAVELAGSYYSLYTVPSADTDSEVSAFGGDVLSGTATAVNTLEEGTVTGDGLTFASDLYSTVNLIISLSNAYNTCDPT